MNRLIALTLPLLMASCTPAYAVDILEPGAPSACSQGSLPPPCAFMFEMMRRITGGMGCASCSGDTCPVRAPQ